MKKIISSIALMAAGFVCLAATYNFSTLRPEYSDGSGLNLVLKQTEALENISTNAGRITSFDPITVYDTFTRTADYSTAYSIGDCISASATATNTPRELLNILPCGGCKIINLKCRTDGTAAVGTFRFWFYRSTNVYAQADNAAYRIDWTNSLATIGYQDVTLAAGTTCTYGMNISDQLPLTSTNGTSVYYSIQTLSAFTPMATTNVSMEITVQPFK